MAEFSESAIWHSSVYQIETTDPVRGGAPSRSPKAGPINIGIGELADRTLFLKGATERGVPAWSATRTYLANDAVTHLGRLWLSRTIHSDSAPAVGNANWRRLWSDADGGLTDTANSTVDVSPSGLITQIVLGSTNAQGLVAVTFPQTFPNACRGVWATHSGTDVMAIAELSGTRSTGGVSLRTRRLDGSVSANLTLQILAIGR